MFGKTWSNPYIQFANEVSEPVMIDGRRYLAIVGGGNFGWRDYRGYLAAFWAEKDDQLVPVASFQINLEKGKPLSLRVTHNVRAAASHQP
jgi:hypothetical protein